MGRLNHQRPILQLIDAKKRGLAIRRFDCVSLGKAIPHAGQHVRVTFEERAFGEGEDRKGTVYDEDLHHLLCRALAGGLSGGQSDPTGRNPALAEPSCGPHRCGGLRGVDGELSRPLRRAAGFDGHAEKIMRLEFGSLGGDGQERYKTAMTRQYQSNASIYGTLGEDAKKSFCSGLNSAILTRSAEFVRTHPQLFEAKAPPPLREPRDADVAAGTLEGFKPFERLYIVRVAENHMMADARKILADPANEADGYIWAMKVMALEFPLLGSVAKLDHPEVASAYEERAEIYFRYIRGEVDGPGVQAQERGNETRKNASTSDCSTVSAHARQPPPPLQAAHGAVRLGRPRAVEFGRRKRQGEVGQRATLSSSLGLFVTLVSRQYSSWASGSTYHAKTPATRSPESADEVAPIRAAITKTKRKDAPNVH